MTEKILIVFADFLLPEDINTYWPSVNSTKAYLASGFGLVHIIADEQRSDTALSSISKNHWEIRRPNLGYDFGSWGSLFSYPELTRNFDYLVFTNSSLIGPLTTPQIFISCMMELPSQVKAVSISNQIDHHFQSFMWGISKELLFNIEIDKFLKSFESMPPDRQLIIEKGEIGLSKYLRDIGITYEAVFPLGSSCHADLNPSIDGWKKLLESGFPYVKHSIVGQKMPLSEVEDSIREIYPDFSSFP